MHIELLAKQIEDAFASVPYPATKLTDTKYYDEGVTKFFKEKAWRNIGVAELRRHYAALAFFEPEAFRYFLPAFMLAELRDPETADPIGDSIMFYFGPPRPEYEATYAKRLALFSEPQRAAIMEFLDYMQEKYGGFEKQVIYASTKLIS